MIASLEKYSRWLAFRASRGRDALLDLLYPRVCVECGRPDPDGRRFLCWDCLARVTFVQPPFCERCGDPVSGRIDHGYVCGFCLHRRTYFDGARSAVRYDGPVGRMICAFKYHGHLWLAADLADFLEECVRAHYGDLPFDAILPVPLHWSKERQRGFNQSAHLAEALSRRLGIPWDRRCLRRIRATPTQTHLTLAQRADNVRGAFKVRWPRWVTGRRFLLIDDVMTTGATVNECARALREAGAASVWVATVGRG